MGKDRASACGTVTLRASRRIASAAASGARGWPSPADLVYRAAGRLAPTPWPPPPVGRCRPQLLVIVRCPLAQPPQPGRLARGPASLHNRTSLYDRLAYRWRGSRARMPSPRRYPGTWRRAPPEHSMQVRIEYRLPPMFVPPCSPHSRTGLHKDCTTRLLQALDDRIARGQRPSTHDRGVLKKRALQANGAVT